jgi:hypothetical protein
MFENKVLRRLFWLNRKEVTREWRRLLGEQLNELYSSRNIVRLMKSRRIRWGDIKTVGGTGEMYTRFWWGNIRERSHLGIPRVVGTVILRSIFRKLDAGA